jgi:ATP-dependent Clp protease adapter protein ClpS
MQTHIRTDRSTSIGSGIDGSYQVILYNDSRNTCDHVVSCLMSIFGHSHAMAMKIMLEAHTSGRTIAQVEGQIEAIHHVIQLTQAGLQAKSEKI